MTPDTDFKLGSAMDIYMQLIKLRSRVSAQTSEKVSDS